ncbi:MAG: hypothetical protein KTR22_04725 [Flavobacteriaceae bacterium]|nr:hypothetical protein [Flavobacteriaceae bacterium]
MYIFPIIQLIAAVVGIWNYKKLTLLREKLFLAFLCFTCLVETGNLISMNLNGQGLGILHNLYSVVSFVFYFYWFYRELTRPTPKAITLVFTTAFLLFTLLAYTLPETWGGRGIAFFTGAIGIMVLTFFHFYQLLNSDEVLAIKHKLSFWVSTALLLFYMGILPTILMANYLDIEDSTRRIILICLNLILYGCYSIGFIWMKKKSSRSS